MYDTCTRYEAGRNHDRPTSAGNDVTCPALPQHVLVMVGPPGSGKTTTALKMLQQHGGWVRANQDELGDRDACERVCEDALRRGNSVIVDRCNFDAQQRSHWIQIAHRECGPRVEITALCFWVPEEECIRRASQRTGHPTVHPERAYELVRQVSSLMVPPETREGFHQVFWVANDLELQNVVAGIQARLPPAPAPSHSVRGGDAGMEEDLSLRDQRSRKSTRSSRERDASSMLGLQKEIRKRNQPLGHINTPHQPHSQPYQSQSQSNVPYQPHSQSYQSHNQSNGQSNVPYQPHNQSNVPYQPHSQPYQSHSQSNSPYQPHGQSNIPYQPHIQSNAPHHPHSQSNSPYQPHGNSQSNSPYQPHGNSPYQPHGNSQSNSPYQPHGNSPYQPHGNSHRSNPSHSPHQPHNHTPYLPRGHFNPQGPQDQCQQVVTISAYTKTLTFASKPLILFDLNGTLTQHTSSKRGSGSTKLRPGVEQLRRLQAVFELGVYSSATERTVAGAVGQIEGAVVEAEGPGSPLFEVFMHRRHCEPAPLALRQQAWDTVKPLHRYFTELSKVILVDDDEPKSLPDEKTNLVLIPCWEDERCDDTMLTTLCDALLEHIPPTGDVRIHTAKVSAALAAAAAAMPKHIPKIVASQPEGDVSEGDTRTRGDQRGGDRTEEPRVPLADNDKAADEPRAVDNDVANDMDKPVDVVNDDDKPADDPRAADIDVRKDVDKPVDVDNDVHNDVDKPADVDNDVDKPADDPRAVDNDSMFNVNESKRNLSNDSMFNVKGITRNLSNDSLFNADETTKNLSNDSVINVA